MWRDTWIIMSVGPFLSINIKIFIKFIKVSRTLNIFFAVLSHSHAQRRSKGSLCKWRSHKSYKNIACAFNISLVVTCHCTTIANEFSFARGTKIEFLSTKTRLRNSFGKNSHVEILRMRCGFLREFVSFY